MFEKLNAFPAMLLRMSGDTDVRSSLARSAIPIAVTAHLINLGLLEKAGGCEGEQLSALSRNFAIQSKAGAIDLPQPFRPQESPVDARHHASARAAWQQSGLD
jgi:hypothetical protein